MDKVIVTALLIIAGVTAAGLVVATLTPIVSSSSRSVVDSQKTMAGRMATDIKVITVHTVNDENLTTMVKNVGNATVYSVEQSDVYITDTDGSRFIVLQYHTSTVPYWNVDGGVSAWTQGQTIKLNVDLGTADALETGHTYLLNFSTPNGVASEYRFKY